MEECVVFLCQEHELTRERRGYYSAFSKRITTVCAPLVTRTGGEFFDDIMPKGLRPLLAIQPEASPRLPQGLVESSIPTGCFQIDTYSGTEKRIRWSMLYDYAFVFHPGYDRLFQRAGHPRAVCLPHAVEADLFARQEREEIYEVGWVGNLKGGLYKTRRRCIGGLQRCFVMNDVHRTYSLEELSEVYTRSKIVVNISRDDYLKDANLRCFEVMGAGALLMTPRPTELSALGLSEGEHYVTFEDEADLHQKISYFLAHEHERRKIAAAARALVLKHHTYDARVNTILKVLEEDAGSLHSPARRWDRGKLHETYLHYFAKNLMLDSAVQEMRKLAGHSRGRAIRMVPMVSKAFVRAVQLSIQTRH